VRGHLREGRERVEGALRDGEIVPASLHAKVLGGAGWLAFRNGDYERAETYAAQSLAAYRALGDEPAVALQLNRLGAAVSGRGDTPRATALQEESAAVYRKLGDRRGLGVVLSNLGYRRVIEGDLEQARLLLEEALGLLRDAGERGSLPLPLVNLGLTAFLQGRHDEALALYREGLETAAELASVVLTIACMDGLAAALAATGDAQGAATLVGAVEAAEADTGISLEPFERGVHERTVDGVTHSLDEDAFAVAYETGRQLTRDEAVAYAVGRARPAAVTA
jgi:tetratricopeptide (TPR) repeat protein